MEPSKVLARVKVRLVPIIGATEQMALGQAAEIKIEVGLL
jgi:hypothetical protein